MGLSLKFPPHPGWELSGWRLFWTRLGVFCAAAALAIAIPASVVLGIASMILP